MENDTIYNEMIIEHSRNKNNRRALPPSEHTYEKRGFNPSCGDDITLQVEIEDNKIKDMAYTGIGCAISQASASMMIDLIKGKSIDEAIALSDKFIGMIKREFTNDEELEDLEDAIILKNISNMPARVKCAVLAWYTLADIAKSEHTL